MLSRAWIAAHRLRRRASRRPFDREAIVREYASGRSFLDVGCMWSVHGRICFVAEEAGATPVTGVDVVGETPEFAAERDRRGSSVRFVQGDLHDPATFERTGVHDVVWRSTTPSGAPTPARPAARPSASRRPTTAHRATATGSGASRRRRSTGCCASPASASSGAGRRRRST